MSKGCPCKSADQPNPNCSFCAAKAKRKPDNKCPPYDSYPNKKCNEGDGDNSGNIMSLIKAVTVFSVGCYLTTQLTSVANEMG